MIIKRTKTITKELEEPVAVKCDICEVEYDLESKNSDDIFESQEFIHIRFTGGYGSIFGDGDTVELDMCQRCFKEKLGDYVRIID